MINMHPRGEGRGILFTHGLDFDRQPINQRCDVFSQNGRKLGGKCGLDNDSGHW